MAAIEIERSRQREVKVSRPELIASFNWDEGSRSARMVVPGHPRVLLPASRASESGHRLNRDSGVHMVDENHYRCPTAPMESLFSAVALCKGSEVFVGVDFVTDRNNLRKLLGFASGTRDKSFQIYLDKRGSLFVLTRRESRDRDEVSGYGHAFEEFATQAAPAGQVAENLHVQLGSHRRIVKYTLGSWTLVVRNEVDACEPPSHAGAAPGRRSSGRGPTTSAYSVDEDDLAGQLSQLTLGQPASAAVSADIRNVKEPFIKAGTGKAGPTRAQKWSSANGLEVVEGGCLLDADSGWRAAELKTKNDRYSNEFNWVEVYVQMVLGGVDELVIGWHNCGTLTNVERLTRKEVEGRARVRRGDNPLGGLEGVLRQIEEAATELWDGCRRPSPGQELPTLVIRFDVDNDELTVSVDGDLSKAQHNLPSAEALGVPPN